VRRGDLPQGPRAARRHGHERGGIHDGIKLANKLAKVVHREAGEELLDVYSRQRHPAR
jgi:hypothetical protein